MKSQEKHRNRPYRIGAAQDGPMISSTIVPNRNGVTISQSAATMATNHSRIGAAQNASMNSSTIVPNQMSAGQINFPNTYGMYMYPMPYMYQLPFMNPFLYPYNLCVSPSHEAETNLNNVENEAEPSSPENDVGAETNLNDFENEVVPSSSENAVEAEIIDCNLLHEERDTNLFKIPLRRSTISGTRNSKTRKRKIRRMSYYDDSTSSMESYFNNNQFVQLVRPRRECLDRTIQKIRETVDILNKPTTSDSSTSDSSGSVSHSDSGNFSNN